MRDPSFRIRRIEPIFASSGKQCFVPLRQQWKTAQTAIIRAEIMMASPAKARSKCFAAIMVMRDNAGRSRRQAGNSSWGRLRSLLLKVAQSVNLASTKGLVQTQSGRIAVIIPPEPESKMTHYLKRHQSRNGHRYASCGLSATIPVCLNFSLLH